MCKNVFAAGGSTPDPDGGAYSAPPDPIAGFGGEKEVRKERERERKKRGERGKWRGSESEEEERERLNPSRAKILAMALHEMKTSIYQCNVLHELLAQWSRC